MTTATITPPPEASVTRRPLLSTAGWAWTALIALGFLALFRDFVWRMFRTAIDSPSVEIWATIKHFFTFAFNQDWSHALVIPFISIYYIALKRNVLLATPRRVFWPGLAVLFFALFLYAWFLTPGPTSNDMLQGYSMILALFGLVLFLVGPRMMKVLWFPIAFLVFAVKVSPRYWEEIAWQLQLIAAKCAAVLLNLLGIDAQVSGSTIHLYRGLQKLESLNVAEACSGLRMLMAFIALGVAMAFLFDRAWWQRLIMCALCVPIAVAVNVGRVTIMGVLNLWAPDFAHGDMHKFVGLLMLIPALLVYMLLGWVLDKIIIHDEDQTPRAKAPPLPGGDAPLAEAEVSTGKVAWGVVLGVVLATAVGASYASFLSYKRPDALGVYIASPVAAGMLVVSGLVILGCCFAAWRMTRTPRGAHGVPIGQAAAVSMALAAGVLFACVFLLEGTKRVNGWVIQKERIDLARPLFVLPRTFGSWQIDDSYKPAMSDEMIETLGTKEFIDRLYVDRSRRDQPGSVAKLHVAYYTGTPDTVPHVPDRCYVAGGMERRGVNREAVSLNRGYGTYQQEPDGRWTALSNLAQGRVTVPRVEFPITLFTYAEPGSAEQSNVLYFFSANGQFLANPDEVRINGFNLSDRYSYYCKIEVGFPDVSDPEVARQRAEAFLSVALPEILACLPDWEKVKAGQQEMMKAGNRESRK
jgi:exosortase